MKDPWQVKDNILSAHLHDDESTPHIHILVVPLACKSRGKAGRPRKGAKSVQRAVAPTWGLAAADWVGSPKRLADIQTAYADVLADLGIRRGIPKRVTGSRHRSAVAYRFEAAHALEVAEADRVLAADRLREAGAIGCDVVETASAFTSGLRAIDTGELVYRASSEDKNEGLSRKYVEKPFLPVDTVGFQKWKRAVKPMVSRLIDYARRVSNLTSREQDLAGQSDDLKVEAVAILRVAERQAAAERLSSAAPRPAERDVALLRKSRGRQPRLR